MASTSGRDAGADAVCEGCRPLPRGCKKSKCVLRPCLEALWNNDQKDQGYATTLLAEIFGREKLFKWLEDRPVQERPDFFVKLLFTAQNLFEDKRLEIQALLVDAAKGMASKCCTRRGTESECPPSFTDMAEQEGTLCVACTLGTELVESVTLIQADRDAPSGEPRDFFVKLLLTIHSMLDVKRHTKLSVQDRMLEATARASGACKSCRPDFFTVEGDETGVCGACEIARQVYKAFKA